MGSVSRLAPSLPSMLTQFPFPFQSHFLHEALRMPSPHPHPPTALPQFCLCCAVESLFPKASVFHQICGTACVLTGPACAARGAAGPAVRLLFPLFLHGLRVGFPQPFSDCPLFLRPPTPTPPTPGNATGFSGFSDYVMMKTPNPYRQPKLSSGLETMRPSCLLKSPPRGG